MKSKFFYALFLFLSFFVSTITFARTVIGQVIKIKGMVTRHFVKDHVIKQLWTDDAFMQRRQLEKDFVIEGLYVGAPIYEGDEVRTEKSSVVQILLLDQTQFSFSPQSVFKFSYFQKINSNKRKASFHHVWGQVRAKIVQKADEGDLKFNTPQASFGIRGTEFISDLGIIQNQREQMNLALLEGELLVSGEGYVKNLKSGQLIRSDGQGLVEMINLAPETVDRLLNSSSTDKQHLIELHSAYFPPPIEKEQVFPSEKEPKKKKNWQDLLQEQHGSL